MAIDSQNAGAESSSSNSNIEVKGLYKIFGKTPEKFVESVKNGMSKKELQEEHGHVLGLKDINLSMRAGSIHINRLIDPTVGEVIVGGSDVCKMNKRQLREFRRHNTAMVFQKFALLPHRTVIQNVVYGLEIQGADKKRQQEDARRWIDRVGLSGFEDNYPNQLSGGMQQRVGLARAGSHDSHGHAIGLARSTTGIAQDGCVHNPRS